MAGSKDDLKDRLTRYRQIKISVIGRKSGQTISIPVCSRWMARSSTSYRCRARRRSGTRTCSRNRRFGLMREALRGNPRNANRRCESCEISGREISRKVWREGREEVLFGIRCDGCDRTRLISDAHRVRLVFTCTRQRYEYLAYHWT